MNENNEKTIELKEEFIVLAIPSSTIEVEIKAKVWEDGKVMDVSKTMSIDEVRAAIKEAQDAYIPSDTVFTLTDIGREKLEELKARYGEDLEDI